MALKAGYKGIKKNVLDTLMSLVGAKVIKTIGNGLSLSDAGALAADIDTDTMEFKDGKLASKGGGFDVKTLTFTGDGTTQSTIDLSSLTTLPVMILGITGASSDGYNMLVQPFVYGVLNSNIIYTQINGSGFGNAYCDVSYGGDNDDILHIKSGTAVNALNESGRTYTVYYV